MDIQELADKLQQDGIAKGKQEAERLIQDAQSQAQEILQNARNEEKRILADAEKKAQELLESSKHNIQLSARDIVLQLQHQLQGIFQTVLHRSASKVLRDEEMLKTILLALIESYEKYTKSRCTKLDIPDNVSENFRSWLQEKCQAEIKQQKQLNGFLLYDKDGGQIEVSPDSVQEALVPFLSQFVRELLKTNPVGKK